MVNDFPLILFLMYLLASLFCIYYFFKIVVFSDNPRHCTRPPAGWSCSRNPGHEGPCAATPTPNGRYKLTATVRAESADQLLALLDKMRDDIAAGCTGSTGPEWENRANFSLETA